MSSLEKEFEASEQARLQAEEKKERQNAGIPALGSTAEAQQKIEELHQVLSHVMEESSAFKRVSKVLELARHSLETADTLQKFTDELNRAENSLLTIQSQLKAINGQLATLTDKIVADLDERSKLRQKQLGTLKKLDDYLKNWL